MLLSSASLDWFCDGESVLRDYLSRQSRELSDVDCDGCLCTFTANRPAAIGQEFDTPRLEEQVQWRVTVSSLSGGDIDLDFVWDKLYQFGVIPVVLDYEEVGDKSQAYFVTRSHVPAGPKALWPARVQIVEKTPVVSTTFSLAMPSNTSRVVLLSQLYAAGVVPESMKLTNETDSPLGTLEVVTRSDIFASTRDVLSTLSGEPVLLTYVAPEQLVDNMAWPLNYTATAGANVTLVRPSTCVGWRGGFVALGLTLCSFVI